MRLSGGETFRRYIYIYRERERERCTDYLQCKCAYHTIQDLATRNVIGGETFRRYTLLLEMLRVQSAGWPQRAYPTEVFLCFRCLELLWKMFNADQIPYLDFDNMQLVIKVTKHYTMSLLEV